MNFLVCVSLIYYVPINIYILADLSNLQKDLQLIIIQIFVIDDLCILFFENNFEEGGKDFSQRGPEECI